MQINKNIFRQYDIRGREGSELNPEVFELIGRAYGTYLARKNIKNTVVGRDIRATSQEFQKSATKGILSAGVNVINLGTVLTPMMYWAQYFFKTEGGVIITASHNPKGWNGAKLASGYSHTMGYQDGLKDIYKMIKGNDFVSKSSAKRIKKDIKEEYFEDLLKRVNILKKFKVVVNSGNGTAGLFAPELLRNAGCEVIEHLSKPDSAYPAYTPNPSELEMMEDTAVQVIKNKADFGFAFDGDGDRLGLVDERGTIIWPDQYLIFLARKLLKMRQGAKIIFDVKSSQALQDDIKKNGGVSIMAPTGHSNIKKMMQDTGAQLAGELSGHIFIKYNYYGFDDALFAALSLLEYFSTQDKTISELVATIPSYVSSPGYLVETSDDKKFEIVEKIKKEFQSEGYEVIDMDGARVKFQDLQGWGLVRASNTSPNLTLRFEAKTKEDLEKIEEVFREKLNNHGIAGEWKTG